MSKSVKQTLVIGGLLLTTAIGVFSFILFQIVEQGAELEVQIAALQEERAQEASYFTLQRIAETSAEDRAQLSTYFLQQESDSIDFLNLIESIAPDAGVFLETNSLESVVDPGDNENRWIEATFSFSGTRADVERFIQILESVPYVSRLTAVSMNARSRAEWRANATIQVKVLSYDE